MTKGKKGQNRKTVISTTGQWPKETKDNKINIGERCEGVTAVKDKIYIGGDDKVIILNIDGSFVREIATHDGLNNNLLYNERNDQLLLRQNDRLCCINLDGHVIYT
jgi:hypothetical protein